MLLVAKNIISDSNLFFYLYNFSQSTTFEYNSFAGCKSLKTIDFKNVEFIGIGAFQETALYSVTFPQTLQYIGSRAFYNCNNLEKVILPEKFSVTCKD